MKKFLASSFVFFIGIIAWVGVPFSPSYAGVEEEIAALKKEVAEIKKEMRTIINLLAPEEPAPKISEVDLGTAPVLGNKGAPLTLIDFSDYHCPFCAKFQQETFPRIKKEYIDKGKVRYAFRNFPLLGIHPQASKAAEAARCAGDQGRYWEMHEFLFGNPKKNQKKDFEEQAGKFGLDLKQYKQCLEEEKYAETITKDLEAGTQAGVRGTPSFLIGKTTPEGKIKGRLLVGAQPFEAFKESIEALLKEEAMK